MPKPNTWDRDRALQLALESVRGYDPQMQAPRGISLTDEGTDQVLKRAKRFAKFLSEARPSQGESDVKSEDTQLTAQSVDPQKIADGLTPEAIKAGDVDVRIGLNYLRGRIGNLGESLSRVQEQYLAAEETARQLRIENGTLKRKLERAETDRDNLKAERDALQRQLDHEQEG